MNRYEHLLYKRGFLFTDKKDMKFKDSMTTRVFKKWSHITFNKYDVYIEPALPHAYYESHKMKVLVMGLVLNPFSSENDIKNIAVSLADKHNDSSFLDYLDELSGRFTIITDDGNATKVYGDAAGTRTLYYDTESEFHIISSHSTLIADLMGYRVSETSQSVLTNKEFTGRKYLPGLMTPFDEIRPITPNTRYVIEKRKVERFFPREELETTEFKDTVDKVTGILKNQASLINEIYKTSTSLTAGLDSRLTFAIQNTTQNNGDYFTHISQRIPEAFQEDVNVGRKLANIYDKKHTIYEYTNDGTVDGFKEFKSVWFKNVGMHRGSVHLFKEYADNYPSNRLHIRSNIAEVVRVYYKKRTGEVNAEKLANLYTTSPFKDDQLVLDNFNEFINTTNFKQEKFYNYNFADLFYWEHRMGMWHSWLVNESDVAYETFVPFNNRKLLKMMLSIPEEERISDELFIEIINNVNPKLMNIPVNKKILK